MVVNDSDDLAVKSDDPGHRIDRLISAVEAQTNMMARLVRLLEPKSKRATGPESARLRRGAPERPIVVNPIVQAAVKRALAKLGR